MTKAQKRAVLLEAMHVAGWTTDGVSAVLGMSRATLTRRLADPDSLTIRELSIIRDVTGMSAELVDALTR